MKYGYNDLNWKDESINPSRTTKFCEDVVLFNTYAFGAFMRRKTVTENDKYYLACLREMVDMMEAHAEKVEKN